MKRFLALVLMFSLIIILSPASFSATKTIEKPSVKVLSKSGWLAKAGVFGSAGRISLGYESILGEKMNLLIEAGYGFGNNYNLASWSNALIYQFSSLKDRWNPFVGLEVNYSDYSKKVIDVPGVSTINQGGGTGIGLLAGLSKSNLFAQIGYDSRSGALVELSYRIGR